MLRHATEADVDAIRNWRNHAQVRNVSLTSHVITPEEHLRWWRAANDADSRLVLIYERDGRPSGVVNFSDLDADNQSASWGFYLDIDGLEPRGELLPAWLEIMSEAIRYAFEELGVDVLEGEVLAENEVVRRMNRRYGFAETSVERRDVDGDEKEVVSVRLRASDWRRA